MNLTKCVFVAVIVTAGMWSRAAFAQMDAEDSKLNTNLALVLTAPLNPTARFTNFGWGVVAGAGYNFNSHHAFVGEFMWNRLSVSDQALNPIRVALQSPDINGHANLFAFTANYRLEFRGKRLGTYFIAGGGLYHRSTSISQTVITGNTTVCTPEFLWWGAQCQSGIVTADQTLGSSSSSVFGGNAGVGFTVRLGEEPRYRFYLEARYHYAPHEKVTTQLIPIAIGFRF
jgi:hypothetical protein